jgi:low affinity Fe/Cu permease
VENISPAWRGFLRNVFLYLVVFFLVIAFSRMVRFSPAWSLILMWVVGLGGVIFLAVQAIQLSIGAEKERLEAEAKMQTYRRQTQAYKKQLDQLLKKLLRQENASVRLEHLQSQVNTWTEAIQDLIDRVNGLRQDPLIQQDLQNVPKAIKELEAKVAAETDDLMREQLNHTLKNRKKQLASLDGLQNTTKRAEMQIESTLSMLGTIYSQLLTSQSTDHVADYSRLSADVDEEVHRLQDHLEALQEVKLMKR